jgi:uncharacterized protein (DUF924 family)
MRAEDILYFWFTENGRKQWWQKSARFDQLIRRRFLQTYRAAVAGELAHWRATDRGRLAEILVLDQFPRNMFRGKPQAFAADGMALLLAQEAVAKGVGEGWTACWRQFLCMPYMHSESPVVHTEAVKLFSASGLEDNLEFEYRHKRIIDEFGRYPHRNEALGRVSTPAEQAFLTKPGSGF